MKRSSRLFRSLFLAGALALLPASISARANDPPEILPIAFAPLIARASDRAAAQSAAFDVSEIDEPVVKRFREAWQISGAGTRDIEGVVLLFRREDGSLAASLQDRTNEHRQLTFRWRSDIVAVVHTHPNRCDPKPQEEDLRIADRFGVPVFTITLRGMFMYDPITKKMIKVHDDLNWLDSSGWTVTALSRVNE